MDELPPPPLIVYDGECAFCARQVMRLRRLNGRRGRAEPFQNPRLAAHYPQLTPEHCTREMKLILANGRILGGAEAAVRALALRRAWWIVAWLYYVPGVRQACDAAYRAIAARRWTL